MQEYFYDEQLLFKVYGYQNLFYNYKFLLVMKSNQSSETVFHFGISLIKLISDIYNENLSFIQFLIEIKKIKFTIHTNSTINYVF